MGGERDGVPVTTEMTTYIFTLKEYYIRLGIHSRTLPRNEGEGKDKSSLFMRNALA
jgi:hypothetical protein